MIEECDEEVRVRVRFPQGGAVLDYRAKRQVADRIVVEFARHGVSITVDDQVYAGLPDLPHADQWLDSADNPSLTARPEQGRDE